MVKYDFEAIKSMVSIEDVIDLCGLETKRIGNSISVLCPFHNDTHFGSARIWKDVLYCFVENKAYDIFHIYCHVFGCTVTEAADAFIREFSLPMSCKMEEKKREAFPFSKKELEAIGLLAPHRRRERYPVKCQEDAKCAQGFYTVKEEEEMKSYGCTIGINDYYVLYQKGKSQYSHLLELYRTDKATFFWLVRNKCRERMDAYRENIPFLSALSKELNGQGIFNYLTETMLVMAQKNCQYVQKIYGRATARKGQ